MNAVIWQVSEWSMFGCYLIFTLKWTRMFDPLARQAVDWVDEIES